MPEGAPVAVKLVEDERVKVQYRGVTLHGFWLGIVPNDNVPAALRSNLDGTHWKARIADVRSDQLVWEPTLSSIEVIDIAKEQVEKEREN